MSPDALAIEALRARLDELVLDHEAELVALRHDLHAHPELSNREVRTAGVVAAHLRKLGMEVRDGIAGHGVIGVLRGGQPGDRVVALRADMDALPVRETTGLPFASTRVDADYPGGPFPVAHACGHDCHTATVLVAASVLASVLDHLAGTVLFVFQPAAEGPPIGEIGGARAMLDAGAFTDPVPTMVFGMHVAPYPAGHIAHRTGTQFAASCLVRIALRGEPTHGSMPWLGVDPYPAAATIIIGVGQIYRQVPAGNAISVSIGHVDDVGRFNIIGETVTLLGTIRCLVASDMADLQRRVTRLCENSARAYGCTAEVEFLLPVPPVRNEPAWIEAVLPTLRRVVGPERVVPATPTMVNDDVSYFVEQFGGVYLQYGVQDTHMIGDEVAALEGGRGFVPNHHPAFYAVDEALATSVRVHVNVAVDHLHGMLDVAP